MKHTHGRNECTVASTHGYDLKQSRRECRLFRDVSPPIPNTSERPRVGFAEVRTDSYWRAHEITTAYTLPLGVYLGGYLGGFRRIEPEEAIARHAVGATMEIKVLE